MCTIFGEGLVALSKSPYHQYCIGGAYNQSEASGMRAKVEVRCRVQKVRCGTEKGAAAQGEGTPADIGLHWLG